MGHEEAACTLSRTELTSTLCTAYRLIQFLTQEEEQKTGKLILRARDPACIYAETMQKLLLIGMTTIHANLGEEATLSPEG